MGIYKLIEFHLRTISMISEYQYSQLTLKVKAIFGGYHPFSTLKSSYGSMDELALVLYHTIIIITNLPKLLSCQYRRLLLIVIVLSNFTYSVL